MKMRQIYQKFNVYFLIFTSSVKQLRTWCILCEPIHCSNDQKSWNIFQECPVDCLCISSAEFIEQHMTPNWLNSRKTGQKTKSQNHLLTYLNEQQFRSLSTKKTGQVRILDCKVDNPSQRLIGNYCLYIISEWGCDGNQVS